MVVLSVAVPCNFGVQYLYDSFHGNVDIVFADDTTMRANSLILSWNSTTFHHLFCELKQSAVDIKDFTKEAAITFLECLYSGDITLEMSIFRELNKLSHVFKTKWLSDHCKTYFASLCQETSLEFEVLTFLFEEAMYVKTVLKCSDFTDIVVEYFLKIENIGNLFVERYVTENYSLVSSASLDTLLILCGDKFMPLLKAMKDHLKDGEIDDSTRYLLSNNQVIKSFADNLDLYSDIYELVALKLVTLDEDFKMLTNLNVSVLKATKDARAKDKKQLVVVQDFTNLFHDWKEYKDLSDKELIGLLTTIPHINIFMLVELADRIGKRQAGIIIKNMPQICLSKSLCKIPLRFLQHIFKNDMFLQSLPQSIISGVDTFVATSSETTAKQLVTTSGYYKMYLQHPATHQCNKNTQHCGFMLKITPWLKEPADNFNIQLVTDDKLYPADCLHCQHDVIGAADMHLTVEWYYADRRRWCNMCISWEGRSVYRVVDDWVVLGGGILPGSDRVRIVVYLDMRGNRN